jgi:hypothetical protein
LVSPALDFLGKIQSKPPQSDVMQSPIVETVRGVDIWKENGGYATYIGMVEFEEFETLDQARRGALRLSRRRGLL